jgi:hypothetical protein
METVRYHICEECKFRFNTIERLPSGWNYEQRYQELIEAIKKVVKDFEE